MTDRRYKVALVVEDFNVGGLERVVELILRSNRLSDFERQLWCLTSGGDLVSEIRKCGIRVIDLKLKGYHDPRNIMKFHRRLNLERIDLIHSHGYYANTFCKLVNLFSRLKLVSHIHTTDLSLSRRHYLLHRMLNYTVDKIICVSKAVAEHAVKFEGADKKKIRMIYNGVTDLNSHRRLKQSADQFTILCVAALSRHKGHSALIYGFAKIQNKYPKLSLALIGDGPERKHLTKIIDELGLPDKVKFLGKIPNAREFFRGADIAVLLSVKREGLGIALIEAMEAGIPTVGTRVGGIREVITHGENGFLVESGSVDDLAEALERLISDTALCRRMGRAGREIYEKKFNADIMIDHINSVYAELLCRKK